MVILISSVELHWHPSRLITLTFFKSWDQKLSSGLLLTFMATYLFKFRFADTEQQWLITLTFVRTWDQKLSSGLLLTFACTHMSPTSEDSGGGTSGFMMKVHLRVLRGGMKVDNMKPEVDPVVFHVWSRRDRVGFRPTSEFELRYWPSVLRDVAFFHCVLFERWFLEI